MQSNCAGLVVAMINVLLLAAILAAEGTTTFPKNSEAACLLSPQVASTALKDPATPHWFRSDRALCVWSAPSGASLTYEVTQGGSAHCTTDMRPVNGVGDAACLTDQDRVLLASRHGVFVTLSMKDPNAKTQGIWPTSRRWPATSSATSSPARCRSISPGCSTPEPKGRIVSSSFRHSQKSRSPRRLGSSAPEAIWRTTQTLAPRSRTSES
jgi:hypothetical protein